MNDDDNLFSVEDRVAREIADTLRALVTAVREHDEQKYREGLRRLRADIEDLAVTGVPSARSNR